MIRRLAALALLLPSLAACCCPRTERCGPAPCDPCGPTHFRVLGEPARPPIQLAPGPGLTVRIEKLNPNEPLPTKIDFEPPAPTDASRAASKPVLVVHAVADLVGGDDAKMDALLGKIRTFITAGADESASAQGVVAIVVKAMPLKQLLVKGLLNDERAAAGLPPTPAAPPPVRPPDPK